jgi:hypothetical protein
MKSSKAGLLDFDVYRSALPHFLSSGLGGVIIASRLGSERPQLGPSTRRLLTGS